MRQADRRRPESRPPACGRAACRAARRACTPRSRASAARRPRRWRRRRPHRPARATSSASSCVRVPYPLVNDTELSLDEAIATTATGDIWLFRGRSVADRAIQALTNSPVNHVGMVVALDDRPPLLWHAELGRSLPDAWPGERQRGVQLHILADAVRTWDERYGQRAWMRRLEGGTLTREHEDKLIETIDKYDGKPFPTTPGLMRSWATGRVRRREVSRETIYCAELVAVTFQHMGLLPDKRPMSWYDPGKFWSGDEIQLVPPYSLGEEIAVRRTSPA